MKCLEKEEVAYTLVEMHEGIIGQHLGARAMANKVLKDGYYWMTIVHDAKEYLKICDKF